MGRIFIFIALTLLWSCSNDDDSAVNIEDVSEPIELSSFSIISFDDNAFYEYQFDGNIQQAVDLNLTEQEGIQRQVFLIHRNESVFGFFNQGNAIIKNFSTESLRFVDDFGGQSNEERISARNDDETLAILYTFPNNSEYFVRVIDVQSTSQFEVSLGILTANVRIYVNGDHVFVIHNAEDTATVFKIDKSTQAVVDQIEFNNTLSGLIFNSDTSIFTFDFSGNYQEYSINQLQLISNGSSGFVPDDSFTYKYRNGTIYSQFQYPQPNFYTIGPASYFIGSNDQLNIDVATIFDNYKASNENTSNLQPVHFDYDVNQEVWIVAFLAQDSSQQERYGYFVINNSGEILQETALPRLPWTVIVHN